MKGVWGLRLQARVEPQHSALSLVIMAIKGIVLKGIVLKPFRSSDRTLMLYFHKPFGDRSQILVG
jgi:hypothetical protein